MKIRIKSKIITLFTGKCYVDNFNIFHKYAEKLLKRPILTCEFSDYKLWKKLRKKFFFRFN